MLVILIAIIIEILYVIFLLLFQLVIVTTYQTAVSLTKNCTLAPEMEDIVWTAWRTHPVPIVKGVKIIITDVMSMIDVRSVCATL